MTNLTASSDHFDSSVYWPRALRRYVLRALFGSGSSTAMEVLLKSGSAFLTRQHLYHARIQSRTAENYPGWRTPLALISSAVAVRDVVQREPWVAQLGSGFAHGPMDSPIGLHR
jgi:hypothetical protein